MYTPRGSSVLRDIESRIVRAAAFALVLLLAVMMLPSSVSRQSRSELDKDAAPRVATGTAPASPLSVVRDAIAEPVRVPTASANKPVVRPRPGTATRSALLAAMRRATGERALFRVDHIAVSGTFAFMRSEALVRTDGELRPTGREFAALFERDASGTWRALELWSLSREQDRPYAAFSHRVRIIVRERGLPPKLLPGSF
ncbi:MAG TPA: hypothetical protein VJ672_06290 [Gemmatimonadaceae bacterium]|nr:hypothetical protein [Gemmatimonadaceae bacterium]